MKKLGTAGAIAPKPKCSAYVDRSVNWPIGKTMMETRNKIMKSVISTVDHNASLASCSFMDIPSLVGAQVSRVAAPLSLVRNAVQRFIASSGVSHAHSWTARNCVSSTTMVMTR